jgi:hypothetical protein
MVAPLMASKAPASTATHNIRKQLFQIIAELYQPAQHDIILKRLPTYMLSSALAQEQDKTK